MSYFINPVEAEQCVFLTYEGEMPATETAAVRYEVIRLLATKGWNRIVVDVTALRSIPTALELFEFAMGLSSELPRTTRIALVVCSEHANFGENVARSDGGFLTLFSDAEKATDWVKGLKPYEPTQNWPTGQRP